MDRLSTVLVLVALAATTACQDQEAGPVGTGGHRCRVEHGVE